MQFFERQNWYKDVEDIHDFSRAFRELKGWNEGFQQDTLRLSINWTEKFVTSILQTEGIP
jgi:hypothetical protein